MGKAVFKASIAFINVALVTAVFADNPNPQWTYAGNNGPSHWAEVSADYALCNQGVNQSPIDIVDAAFDRLFTLDFDYATVPLQISKRNHTLEIDYGTPTKTGEKFVEIAGQRIPLTGLSDFSSELRISNEAYALQKIQFHSPSEHTYEHKPFPMEVQLIHKNQDNQYAIVTVFFKLGKANTLLEQIWQHIPALSATMQSHAETPINAAQFLPKHLGYYHYRGSLTMPPCTEGVRWFVLKEPIQLSKQQLATFTEEFTANNRPTQPRNFRFLLESL